MVIFQQIPSGGDRNFGYIVGCEASKKACLVDPSPDPEPCYKKIIEMGLSVLFVINTHSHYDHSAGNPFFKREFNASIVRHESAPGGDVLVEEGKALSVGELLLSFMHTPGHSPDSICVIVNNNLISGDTLFVGKVGGTSTIQSARQEFESLLRLMRLDDSMRIWPGHNYGIRATSTIGEERRTNPFCLRLNNFDDFYWIKVNWLAYKQEHNIK